MSIFVAITAAKNQWKLSAEDMIIIPYYDDHEITN